MFPNMEAVYDIINVFWFLNNVELLACSIRTESNISYHTILTVLYLVVLYCTFYGIALK